MLDLNRAPSDFCGGFHRCKDRAYDPAYEDCQECKKDADDAIAAIEEENKHAI